MVFNSTVDSHVYIEARLVSHGIDMHTNMYLFTEGTTY